MVYHNSHDPQEATEMGKDRSASPQTGTNANSEASGLPHVGNGAMKPAKVEDLTDRVLRFFSAANNETLGACAVGLASIIYFVLGRVGLVIIGIIGGAILHAAWEEIVHNQANGRTEGSSPTGRRETSLRVVERVLNWQSEQQGQSRQVRTVSQDTNDKAFARKELDFSGFRSATATALDGLTDAVIRDYVKWWYVPVLPKELSFPIACRQTLTGFLLSISSQLSRKRPADTFLDFLTNSSSIVIVFLSELSSALMSPESFGQEPVAALSQYLDANPESSLANVVDYTQQEKKLKAVAEDILQNFLEFKAYNCEPVRAFLREVLAGLVLEMTVQSCSKPEWINGWIIYLLEEADTELIDAIDTGVGVAAANGQMKRPYQSIVDERPIGPGMSASGGTPEPQPKTDHKRTLSRAEDAMEEAMQEAKRLSELMAAEDERKNKTYDDSVSSGLTTAGRGTPTSSQSDPAADNYNSPTRLSGEGEEVPTSLNSVDSSVPSFTSFDQIMPVNQPTVLQSNTALSRSTTVPPLTLYNAVISIFDDSSPGERGTIRTKPTVEYLLQIEPATIQHPGWMIARKYADFETLHEVLRRISVVSGVAAFTERYASIPRWKNRSKGDLRVDLERYLRNALSFERLAESEGMKRFLEKDQGLGKSSPGMGKGSFGFPSPAAFETMGKGMLDVLVSAPRGVAGGGKVIVGGVSGVLGSVGSLGQKKQGSGNQDKPAQRSDTHLSRIDSNSHTATSPLRSRESVDTSRNEPDTSPNSMRAPPLPVRPDQTRSEQHEVPSRPSMEFQSALDHTYRSSIEEQKSNGIGETIVPTTPKRENELHLPPPPSEISDDYNVSQESFALSASENQSTFHPIRTLPETTHPPEQKSISSPTKSSDHSTAPSLPEKRLAPPDPLSEKETQVAVELFFAVINELYTLSSAWNIRRTLLNAAKSFLLRPGNPNLDAIRLLLQRSLIDANTSDAGIASHIIKLRENTLPTEEELKTSPPPPTAEEKASLRVKARKLLVERGMPQALTSVMGAAASGEALGRVFDCLQVERVARGLMFALVLQGIRAVTQ